MKEKELSFSAETITTSIANRQRWSFLFVMVVAGLIFFPNLGATRLWDEDEGFYASTAAEMMRTDQRLVPHFNGHLFAHKPPLMYWMMMCGFRLFGIAEFGARFFSAVFGLLTVLLVCQLGKQLFSQTVGLISALILATSIMFTVVGRSATADLYLTFFITLAFWCFVCTTRASLENRIEATNRWFMLLYVALGLATLTKGPIGFLFPMASIGLFLMIDRSRFPESVKPGKFGKWNRFLRFIDPRNFLGALWELRPITAISVITAVAAPWFFYVAMETDGVFLKEFFGIHHFQRALSSMEGHRGSVIYYPVSILVGMYPWTVATLPMIWLVVRKLKSNAEDAKEIKLLVCWVGVYLVGFTFAGTKLPNYVLPAYPAIALVFGFAIESWIRSMKKGEFFWGTAVFGVLIFFGLLIAVLCPGIAFWKSNGTTLLEKFEVASDVKFFLAGMGLIGIPAIVCGTLGILFVRKNKPNASFWVLFSAAFLTLVMVWNLIVPSLHSFQGTQALIQRLRQDEDYRDQEIALYEFFRPSVVFYSGRSIRRCHDSKQVDEFFQLNPQGLMIATFEKYDSMSAGVEFSYRIVDRQSRFPEKGELVVFAREITR